MTHVTFWTLSYLSIQVFLFYFTGTIYVWLDGLSKCLLAMDMYQAGNGQMWDKDEQEKSLLLLQST